MRESDVVFGREDERTNERTGQRRKRRNAVACAKRELSGSTDRATEPGSENETGP